MPDPGTTLADRRLVFFGGKGGVGKTTLASAFALGRARTGARVLVVSTDPAHNLGHLWDRRVGDTPVRLATRPAPEAPRTPETTEPETTSPETTEPVTVPGSVDGVELDPRSTVDRHLAGVEATMYRVLPERLRDKARAHLETARDAPGTHEAAVLERMAEVAGWSAGPDPAYDLVVFDTAPTGHTVRLLSLPTTMTRWTDDLIDNRERADRFAQALQGVAGESGTDRARARRADELTSILRARRERFAVLRDALTDPARAGFVVVTTPERMPVTESLDLARDLRGLDVDLAGVVVNRLSPQDAGPVLAARRSREDTQVERLRAGLDGTPVWTVGLDESEVVSEAGLARLADHLD
ncbi:ArsA family ATPase [Brevibacterium litoralis]|uniref:ArsA family ATPase n=1 Tax=Brevibacterium litoralis TaxID=3138935 RepID=UPI0032EFBC65